MIWIGEVSFLIKPVSWLTVMRCYLISGFCICGDSTFLARKLIVTLFIIWDYNKQQPIQPCKSLVNDWLSSYHVVLLVTSCRIATNSHHFSWSMASLWIVPQMCCMLLIFSVSTIPCLWLASLFTLGVHHTTVWQCCRGLIKAHDQAVSSI